ncbi:undecaprenyldiphospho-muramoylpentapeptide beta-N-acetylglucosaminyltransferase [Neobacillus sedimentimangrovi]|uniref:UDP-N-acetylglucosamine--N-acetylmuramyl-(pentapeptide) pyrophosphoryl-undecaprenol N-acetylglucosamine transferase n=1 Tax=Neobacillus sedimentimangrovi TaxID=2699460 RepID=A0ABS8QJ59_9BACI|nr:undecaprenyldiphospho-muramoylpentapeptide beta-N-acetylglucosaminyltransferase [Neobacillus sedimentimangrovi]MCD4839227.1 undecaprenyldiphospho-muramoylpentapeptide beta-N-acetylglucosaminyltransferase [Neobacillus sedimentimangrovi]
MAKKTIVFTGGGSAGHVTPNLAIINEIKDDWNIHYIGSKKGIEKELIRKINIPYHSISSGKLRRYIDFENVIDIFRVLKGCLDARRILKKLKPDLVFSKGGFVSVPVIIAARSLKIPIFIHESDMTPGLANKISQRFATKIFTSFEETEKFFPKNKVKAIGSPIRKEVLSGSAERGRRFLGFDQRRPILTIMGGSLGAKRINEAVREALSQLTEKYQIVHLCGKNNVDESLADISGYKQFEYVHEELSDILAATDLVITRGGSNAIFEFLALNIPMLIIPLGLKQSRGDQILNAQAFEEKGFSLTLEEENLTSESLIKHLEMLEAKEEEIRGKMKASQQGEALKTLVTEIYKFL